MKLSNYEQYACSKSAKNFVVSDLDALRLKNTVGDVDITVVQMGSILNILKQKRQWEKRGGFDICRADGLVSK